MMISEFQGDGVPEGADLPKKGRGGRRAGRAQDAPGEASAGIMPEMEKAGATVQPEVVAVEKNGGLVLHQEPQVLPVEPGWEWAVVTRLDFVNPDVIQVRRGNGDLVVVRVHPDWRAWLKPKMAIGVRWSGVSWQTRRPKRRFWW